MAATVQGLPTRLFSNCTFSSNTAPTLGGGAISINGGKSMGRVPDMRFVRCAFQDNSAPTSLGGAISVVGMGWVRFDKCLFFGNRAGVSGGGVFSSDTYLSFSQATFNNNMALGKYNGGTGVYVCTVYAVSNELVPNMAVHFCSSSFSSNRGFYKDGGALTVQTNADHPQSLGKVAFCDGAKPVGSIVPTIGWSLEFNCPARCVFVTLGSQKF
ncbi:unnamed protein product [Closterium sp. NIES-65]|nr:unnamed protein product [Closterium sp. NIES-65]